jgi:hypothetical protein
LLIPFAVATAQDPFAAVARQMFFDLLKVAPAVSPTMHVWVAKERLVIEDL